ncbi:MAG: sulfurtransferase-like selenium metabolism protein YedF [Oscillospiraceae bacterium]|nr:sulfurtransferase-like selenium metabolism protein YedF [Oscillospiraceae bacterium]
MVYFITAEQLGISELGPGKNLMNNYIHALTQHKDTPNTILLVNTAVRLAAENAETLEDMKNLAERGCEILLCGMCVNYYELNDKIKVGKISNMLDISRIVNKSPKVVTL